MTDDPVKKENGAAEDGSTDLDGAEPSVDPAFRVDVPDDLLEEAVESMERRIAEAKGGAAAAGEIESDDAEGVEIPFEETMEFTADGGAVPEDVAVEVETTSPEDRADFDRMSIDDILASGLIPDKLVSAFNEERQALREARNAEREAREKLAAALAESENFRKRVTREKNEALKFANEPVLKEILPVFDNLERALQYRGDTAATVVEGVQITLRQFMHVLQKVGLERVESSPGTPFDPHVHEAVAQVESADVAPNTIAEVLQGGFTYHERLLRPAMVSVAKAPAAAKTASASGTASASEAAPAGDATAPDPAGASDAEAEAARLERIRRVGAAAREARRKAREQREASTPEPRAAAGSDEADGDDVWPDEPADAAVAGETETDDERRERIRRVGAAAREARRKKREAQAAAASAPAPASAAGPAAAPTQDAAAKDFPVATGRAVPSFEADDLDDWESSMESVRTDKSTTGSGGSR